MMRKYDIFMTDDVQKIKELMKLGWEYIMTYKEMVYLRSKSKRRR